MAFQPTSNIYIGTVPFDNSYRHIRYIPNRQEQAEHFKALCPEGLRRDDYTYQRMDNSVVVPFNAETLYGYNYVMFQNENYGDRWFYAFVNDIEYVNPSSSRLRLELDIMQTWFPDCTVKPCMVDREHVNNDNVGAHIKDEGLDPGELICMYAALDNTDYDLVVIAASCVEPLADGTYVNTVGDTYMGMYSGVSLSAFLTLDQFKQFMAALSSNGQQDAVSAVYMVPRFVIPELVKKDNGYGYWVGGNATTPRERKDYDLGYTTLDGYTPKNNKMYTFPYEYVEITNFTGQTQQYRMEFWGNNGTCSFEKSGGVDINSRLTYTPVNYNGVNRYLEGCLQMDAYPTCNWVYQSFANEWGASKVAGIDPKTGSGGQALPASLPGFNSMQLPLMQAGIGSMADVISNAITMNPLGMAQSFVGGMQEMTNAYASLSRSMHVPNTTRSGTNSTTALVNLGSYTMGIRKYTCRYEMAKQIDDFFSVYGYTVAETKTPNITGRQSWNYVKTNGASIVGKVPSRVLSTIASMLDKGITFWHTDDVGNYSLPNGIV